MKKVIIAEDLITLVEKDNSFFKRTNIRTITAATNKELLALHRTEKADLIITNIDMPEMNAEELCTHIRNDDELRSVSIIIVCPETAANLQRCVQCGANAFVTTPVNHAVLLQEAHLLLHVTPRRSCRIGLKLKIEGKWIASDIPRGLAKGSASEYKEKNIPCIEIPCGPTRGSLQSKENPFTGLTENISASGMLFRSAAILFEGDSIRCSFSSRTRSHISKR